MQCDDNDVRYITFKFSDFGMESMYICGRFHGFDSNIHHTSNFLRGNSNSISLAIRLRKSR